ncbi:hypothetical protein [Streptomyces sp. NPDC040750]|uniref:hypothetical protein n=1 Tax=Streptomyces sp. NPDC040750 TaxID=3154491 RepID=UPI0033D673C8
MTAEHEDADRVSYDGTDALMAAITGTPLPPEARRDAAFRAEHRAAEADLAVLRTQLIRLAETLTGGPSPGTDTNPAGGHAVAAGKRRARVGARAGTRSVRGGRPSRAGRRAVVGSLAGVAVCSLVVGFGWLLTHSAGDATMSGGAGADGAKGAADAPAGVPGDAGRPSDPARELACSRLVVEGTVARVARRHGSPETRITLTVTRSYRPARGPAEVTFLLGAAARPSPRAGQHVLVRIGQGEGYANRWTVGDRGVAAARAWITEALPASAHLTCP